VTMKRRRFTVALAGAAFAALMTSASALDLNSFRAQNGLPRLSVSAALSAKARAHAADMARRQSMDHNGFYERMRGSRSAAENVAAGCPTADCVFKIWAESSGHRANMLNGSVTHYGLASARGADGQRYWVLELGN
jgi:uncharacterized protein YkwD